MVQELSYDAWGRLRNPATRRFLSPAPYVQNPFFSQNFNRYSYALNNPFKYTDQSGEFIGWVVAGLILGGKWYHDGYKANNNEPNPVNWDWKNTTYSVGYSSNNDTFYAGLGWNNDYSMLIGYNSTQGVGGGYAVNGSPNLYHPNYNYNAPEEAAAKAYNNAVQLVTKQQSATSSWEQVMFQKLYNIVPAAQSFAVGIDINMLVYETIVPIEVLMIYKGQDAGSMLFNWYAGGGGGILLDAQAVAKMTNYFYIGDRVNELRADDFLGWNSGGVSFSIGEFVVGGGAVSWTNLSGNRGYLIGITGEAGVGVGIIPFGVSAGKTATTNYGQTKW
ncbi:hypothetical protein FACS189413_14130 [Bacteroidia bacterium]|nr:hypothetical protein FACS189413_14130 [Bacteroidia bacterium]